MADKKVKVGDDSIMSFGKHKGKSMANVPDDWLLWYYKETKPMINYIESCFGESELTDI